LPVGLGVFCELHPEASTELHNTMQHSHFHHSSENGRTVLPDNNRATWSVFICDFRTPLREFLDCEPLYATNTSHRKQETFLYEYPFQEVLLPTKNAQQHGTIWGACYLHCHQAELCYYLVINIENLLCPLQLITAIDSSFTSFCNLFTDSLLVSALQNAAFFKEDCVS
jgi:hypothetical protein